MGLNLKVMPKRVYWTRAVILCPQDHDEIADSAFEVQFERFTRSEIERFEREQRAINQHAGLEFVRRLGQRDPKSAETVNVLETAYAESVEGLDADFDPGVDFARSWLGRKIKGFRGLECEDGRAVTIEDLDELLEILSYRIGLMSLLRKQLEDPNAPDRKN